MKVGSEKNFKFLLLFVSSSPHKLERVLFMSYSQAGKVAAILVGSPQLTLGFIVCSSSFYGPSSSESTFGQP